MALAGSIAFTIRSAKDPIREDRASPGYTILRDRSLSGIVDNYEAVEPDSGWTFHYSVNDGDVVLRFRGNEMEMRYRPSAKRVADAISSVAEKKGYSFEAEAP